MSFGNHPRHKRDSNTPVNFHQKSKPIRFGTGASPVAGAGTPIFGVGTLNYKIHLSNIYEKYYMNASNSDVTLIVGDTKIPAHRFILAAESNYFQVLLYNESFYEANKKEIPLEEAPLPAFKLLLTYLYCRIPDLTKESLQDTLDFLELANRYDLLVLKEGIVAYLKTILSASNVLTILPMADLMELTGILDASYTIIDNETEGILASDAFLTLKADEVISILQRSTKSVSEIKTFRSVQKWLNANPTVTADQRTSILACVNLSLMSITQITQSVRASRLYDDAHLLQVIQSKGFEIQRVSGPTDSTQSLENLVNKGPAFVASAEMLGACGKLMSYHNLTIEMNDLNFINHITMKIVGQKGYAIEVSADNTKWTKVVQFYGFDCADEQDIYFDSTEAKFIRITAKTLFTLNSFRVFDDAHAPRQELGVIRPTENFKLMVKSFGAAKFNFTEDEKQQDKFTVTGFRSFDPRISFQQPYYINVVRVQLQNFDGTKQMFSFEFTDGVEKFEVVGQRAAKEDWYEAIFTPTQLKEFSIKTSEKTFPKPYISNFTAFFDEASLNNLKLPEDFKFNFGGTSDYTFSPFGKDKK